MHYYDHTSPPLPTIVCQINPVHNLLFYFFKIHVILSFHLCLQFRVISSVSHQNPISSTLPCMPYNMPTSFPLISSYKQYMARSTNNQVPFCNLHLNTLNLYASHNIRDSRKNGRQIQFCSF
jgi:hypothetical protein